MNPQNTFVCPNCKKKVSIDEALKSQIKDQLENALRDEFNKKWLEQREKDKQKSEEEKAVLEAQLKKQADQLEEAYKFELELRNRARELEEKEKNLELEKQRQIDEERKKIQEKTEIEMTERYHLKEKEKDQIIESLRKSLEEAQRKASVGSQQLQGEVMELELEDILRREFPTDEILPVAKGIRGADVIQIVKDRLGRVCGKIVWESKRTKSFGGDWIEKLKEDMRGEKADIAVLISLVLPEDVNLFTYREGVYISAFESFLAVGQVLRKNLIDISATKALSVGKNEKIEALYKYITSSEFTQKIESMLETFSGMQKTLEKEKMVMQRVWAQRDKEIERLKNNTLNIHGSLSGLIEEGLPQIKSLEFDSLEIIFEDDNK